jgi:dUTP pyrophosphatase
VDTTDYAWIKSLETRLSALEERPTLKVKKLKPNAVVPEYQTPGAAGLDLVATKDVYLDCGSRDVVPTGIAIEVPEGWEAQIRPRSGNAIKLGLTVLNTPGTVDADYRGEVGVILINLGPDAQVIKAGARIAQLVIARAPQAVVVEVEALSETQRGAGGFGSTGK